MATGDKITVIDMAQKGLNLKNDNGLLAGLDNSPLRIKVADAVNDDEAVTLNQIAMNNTNGYFIKRVLSFPDDTTSFDNIDEMKSYVALQYSLGKTLNDGIYTIGEEEYEIKFQKNITYANKTFDGEPVDSDLIKSIFNETLFYFKVNNIINIKGMVDDDEELSTNVDDNNYTFKMKIKKIDGCDGTPVKPHIQFSINYPKYMNRRFKNIIMDYKLYSGYFMCVYIGSNIGGYTNANIILEKYYNINYNGELRQSNACCWGGISNNCHNDADEWDKKAIAYYYTRPFYSDYIAFGITCNSDVANIDFNLWIGV